MLTVALWIRRSGQVAFQRTQRQDDVGLRPRCPDLNLSPSLRRDVMVTSGRRKKQKRGWEGQAAQLRLSRGPLGEALVCSEHVAQLLGWGHSTLGPSCSWLLPCPEGVFGSLQPWHTPQLACPLGWEPAKHKRHLSPVLSLGLPGPQPQGGIQAQSSPAQPSPP